jgi:hypothetical protein
LKSTYENRIIKQTKTKLNKERTMITKADKVNILIILYKNDNNKKVNNFISNTNIHKTANNSTNRLQRDIRNTVNEFQNIMPKEKRWKYISINSAAPNIRGMLTHFGRVTQICVFITVKLGTSASYP